MKSRIALHAALALLIGFCAHGTSVAQTVIAGISQPGNSFVSSRVVERVDDARGVRLAGNIHPMARPQFDQGLVDTQLPMERIQLVLKRSAEQEAALEQFMAEQYDPRSENFHHWLTADEFGRLYGPSDNDIAAVTNWLEGHGFQIDFVSKGRVTIEFSGTAYQVQQAFQVEMHRYLVNGKMHIANDRDPQIPEALSPVVAGIASLHDFFPVHQSVLGRFVKRDAKTGKVTPVDPVANDPSPQYGFPDPSLGNIENEDITPYDFAAIYNLTPLWNAGITGKGQSIAIAAETDINLADVTTFRTAFGLSGFAGTSKIVLNGTDPGTIQGDLVENTLDTEWSGATAPDAQVLVVVTKGTATSSGGLLSISYIVDNQVATIMSGSYGECEAGLGSAGNTSLNAIYQQGSTEGISMFESAGDQGSTGCDNSDATTYPAPAQNGLAVNGFASSPYITGVGGTDIVWQEDPYSRYWTATNAANGGSAIGYIPEVPWNSTCTSYYLLTYVYTGQTSSEALCNNAITAGLDDMVRVVGGSGGASGCLSLTAGNLATCTGAYAKPSWQTGTGVPNDKVRDVPDVSLFASGGLPSGNGGSAYLICVSSNSPDHTCDYTGAHIVAQEVGGTSVSSPAMAGIMALVQQKTGTAQGLANPVLYQLAAKDNRANCNSSTVANGNTCTFYDVTLGTNAMPCVTGSLNCVTNTSTDKIGIVSGYSSTTGYDQATGLGSVNAYNLVSAWPGGSITGSVTVSPVTYAFPATTVSTTSATTGVITVTNGTSAAVNFTSATFSGADASSFAASTTCPSGATLAAGATCTVTMSFDPTTAGALSATLDVVDGTGTQTVAVTGTGLAATTVLSVTPSSLSFASTTVGSTTAAQSVTVKNTGTGTVTLTSETIAGTNASSFVIAPNTCGASLATGDSCVVSVAFDPSAAGTLSANLSVSDDATGSPQTVTLTGTGVAAPTYTVSVSPSSLTFASATVGSPSSAQTVTVKNTGTGTVTLTSEAITGVDAPSFTASANTCGSTLAAAASCTISVEFNPASAGTLSASLSITDSATGSPQTVTLTGTGVAAPTYTVSVSPSSLTFASATVGSPSAAQNVTVKNTGTGTVTLTSEAITGADASSFTASANTCGSTLAAGASCTVSVEFDPASAGTLSASLSITDSATGSPQSVALSGTGTAPPPLTTTTTLSSSNLSTGTGVTITLTASVTKASGVPTGTVTFLNGTASLGTGTLDASGSASLKTSFASAGTYSLTAAYGGDATSAKSTSAAVTETVVTVGLSAAFSPSSLTIVSGQSGTLTLTLTPTGGYTGNVAFSCGTLPADVSCTFAPPSLTIASGSGAVTDTLTINTSATTTAMLPAPRSGPTGGGMVFATALWLPGLLTITGLFRRRSNRFSVRRLTMLAFVCGVLLGLGGMAGCGGGSSSSTNGAKPGTYTVPVTLTLAGGAVQNVSVTIVVQ